MMSIKRFQILFTVCMIKLIAGNELDSVASTNAGHHEPNGELEVLSEELRRVLEGQNKIEHELEILETNNLHSNGLGNQPSPGSSSNTPSLDDVLRYVQSSKSTHGVYYHGVPININDDPIPHDCQQAFDKSHRENGLYQIQPVDSPKLMVVCDMTSYDGGWTVVQNRFDGSQDFFLEWRDYKFGFGNLDGEFWLGLENIHALTQPKGELLVELVNLAGDKETAVYGTFVIGPETDGYQLTSLEGFSGDAGDSLTYHKGQKFSTKDYDQDSSSENCAQKYYGAWWYNACLQSNLNGKFINIRKPPTREDGLYWKTFGEGEMAKSRLLVKTKNYGTNVKFNSTL